MMCNLLDMIDGQYAYLAAGGWGRPGLALVYSCSMYFTALLGGRHFKSMFLASEENQSMMGLSLTSINVVNS